MNTIQARVLLVDRDTQLLKHIALHLSSIGFEVETVSTEVTALARASVFQPQLVVVDADMGGGDSKMSLFEVLHEQYSTLPIILLKSQGTISDAVIAMRRGAFGFLAKPVNLDELLKLIAEALLNHPAKQNSVDRDAWRRQIVTRNPLMEKVLTQAHTVAQSKVSVFIGGADGTGKELLARAIHQAGSRKEGPFVAVDCGALPENLLETELFGHRKGAFSGATRDHKGLFQAATGGTLFLDGLDRLPKSFQAKLLHALQKMRVRPVGAAEEETVDVRIIAAARSDLEQAVREGHFLDELYCRLNVVTLLLPPIAERKEDIPILAAHFIHELSDSYGGKAKAFSQEAMESLVQADWPGNVRQLRQVVEECLASCSSALIPLATVSKALRHDPFSFVPLQEARDQFERNYLVRLLQVTDGNVAQAAKLARRNRMEFYRLLSRHGLTPGLFKNVSDVAV